MAAKLSLIFTFLHSPGQLPESQVITDLLPSGSVQFGWDVMRFDYYHDIPLLFRYGLHDQVLRLTGMV